MQVASKDPAHFLPISIQKSYFMLSRSARAVLDTALVEDREDPNLDFQPLAKFKTNPAGAVIVSTLGPPRHVVVGPSGQKEQRYLVIVPAEVGGKPKPVES